MCHFSFVVRAISSTRSGGVNLPCLLRPGAKTLQTLRR